MGWPEVSVVDEMERLAAFRANTPGPSPETTSRARRRLLRQAMGSRIVSPHRRLRRLVVGGFAATVIAGGAVGVGISGWGGSSPAPATQASVVLLAASRTAAAEPATTVMPGQYIYVHRTGTAAYNTAAVTYLQSQVYEAWLPPDGDGSGRIRVTYGPQQYLGDGDARRLASYGVKPPAPGSQQSWTIPPDQVPGDDLADPSYAFLQTLPTDPDKLFALISEDAQTRGVTPPQQMLDTVSTLLSWSVAPPELRAALYQVAARIPGIQVLGAAVDASGRPGTALAVIARGLRYELIFDPATAALLGTRTVVVDDPTGRLRAGTVLDDEAITIFPVATLGATAPGADPATTESATRPTR